MAAKAKQNAKKKNRLLRIAVVLFLCFVCYTIVKLQIGISQMGARLEKLESQGAQLELENQEKNEIIALIQKGEDSDEFKAVIEQYARETLNYIYPDEIIYTDLP